MDIFTKGNVDIKIFIGIPLSTEIKIALSQSEKWQQALATGADMKSVNLSITRHLGNEYLGFFFPKSEMTTDEFGKGQKDFKRQVNHFCPELDSDNLSQVSFAQVFIK